MAKQSATKRQGWTAANATAALAEAWVVIRVDEGGGDIREAAKKARAAVALATPPKPDPSAPQPLVSRGMRLATELAAALGMEPAGLLGEADRILAAKPLDRAGLASVLDQLYPLIPSVPDATAGRPSTDGERRTIAGAVVLNEYNVGRSKLKELVRLGNLTDCRQSGHAKNSPLVLDADEVDRVLTRRNAPLSGPNVSRASRK